MKEYVIEDEGLSPDDLPLQSWREAGQNPALTSSAPASSASIKQTTPSPAASHATTAHDELARAAQRLGQRIDEQDEELEDDEAALRWRRALLRLSETFLDAAEERRDLSPILLGALHNALEQLLIHGEEADLMALEEWLSHEAPYEDEEEADDSTPTPARPADLLGSPYTGSNRRLKSDRRSNSERRGGERRSLKDRRQ